MTIGNKLIHYTSATAYNTDKINGRIDDSSIAFVDDVRIIYTHGIEYCGLDFTGDINSITRRIDDIVEEWGKNLTQAIEDLQAQIKNPDNTNYVTYSQMVAYVAQLLAGLSPTAPSNVYTIDLVNALLLDYYKKGEIDEMLRGLTSGQGVTYIPGNGINISGSTISLKPASKSEIGGIKLNYVSNGSNYAVQTNTNGDAFVYVPAVPGSGSSSDVTRYYEQAFIATDTLAVPATPSNDFPNGSDLWSRSALNTDASKYVWMCTRLIDTNGTWIDSDWNGPWLISGPEGQAGADGGDIEFIYRTNNDPSNWPSGYNSTATNNGKTPEDDDFVPLNWYDNAQGINGYDRTCEWISIRTKKNGEWSAFGTPILWSHWGQNGTDGDGVEYIFYANTTGSVKPSYNPFNWAAYDEDEYTGPTGSPWTDNPWDLERLGAGAMEWVSIRKKKDGHWGKFCEPKLWSRLAYDGVVDGYTVDLTNENMPICVDDNGDASNYQNKTKIQVFHNGIPTYSFIWSVDITKIYRSDNATIPENTVTVTEESGVLVVNVASITNFKYKNLFIPITVTIGSTTRECVITLYGVASGEAGNSIELKTSTDIIQTDWDVSMYLPGQLEVWCLEAKGSTEVNKYYPNTQGSPFSFEYAINTYNSDRSSIVYSTPQGVPSTGIIQINSDPIRNNIAQVVVYLKYTDNGITTLIDQETIPVVRNGKPGIDGHAATNYNIDVTHSSLIKDQETQYVSGQIQFKITKTDYTSGTGTVYKFYRHTDNKYYWMIDNPTDKTLATENITVKIGNITAGIGAVNGTGSTGASVPAGTNVVSAISSTNDVFNVTATNAYTTYNYSFIQLTNSLNQVLCSMVIPFAVKGLNGTNASVQSIAGPIMRFREWQENQTYYYNGEDNGLKVIDVVHYTYATGKDGYYRVTEAVMNRANAPADSTGQLNTGWVEFTMSPDTFVNNLAANNAYIKNITSRQVIAVDRNLIPVAGFVTDEAVGNDEPIKYNDDSVRIFAGPLASGIADVNTAPFYVKQDGSGRAAGGNITWDASGNVTLNASKTSVTTNTNITGLGNLIDVEDFSYDGSNGNIYIHGKIYKNSILVKIFSFTTSTNTNNYTSFKLWDSLNNEPLLPNNTNYPPKAFLKDLLNHTNYNVYFGDSTHGYMFADGESVRVEMPFFIHLWNGNQDYLNPSSHNLLYSGVTKYTLSTTNWTSYGWFIWQNTYDETLPHTA